MILSFTVIDMATGKIKRRISCQDIDVQAQLDDGEGYVFGDVDDSLYSIDVSTGEPIENPPPAPPTLEEVKAAKAKSINMAAQQAIYAGYESAALGAVYHYPAKDKDQVNMIASVTDSYNPENPVDWSTPFWCADASDVWAYRMHSAEQIRQAGSDGKLAILMALNHTAMLQATIAAATTIEEVTAVTW